MAKHLGLRPLFIVRAAAKSYINEVRLEGGFTLVFKYQLYPFGQKPFADRVRHLRMVTSAWVSGKKPDTTTTSWITLRGWPMTQTNAPSGIGDPTGPTRVLEEITLSPDGNHYTGSFTLDAYDTAGNRVAHIIGTISATRITLDTTVPDLLWKKSPTFRKLSRSGTSPFLKETRSTVEISR
jgi:hypothetical protein